METRMAEAVGAGRDEESVRRFVEQSARMLADWGFPRMPARVLMTIMSADEDVLSAKDLADRLSVSPAAVSGAVRYLLQLGLLAREPVPGSRRDHYRMPDDAWYEAMVTEGEMLTKLSAMADDGTAALGGRSTPAGARVAEMAEYYRFVRAEMAGMQERWRVKKAPPPR
jgi:biotin operon repressor